MADWLSTKYVLISAVLQRSFSLNTYITTVFLSLSIFYYYDQWELTNGKTSQESGRALLFYPNGSPVSSLDSAREMTSFHDYSRAKQ